MWTREALLVRVKTPKVYVSAASVSSFLVGGVAGHILAQKKLQKKYEAIADKEIKTARDFYSRVFDKPDPSDLVNDLAPVVPLPQPSTDAITEADVMEAVEALGQYKGDPVDPEFVKKMNDVLTNPGNQEVAETVEKNVWDDENRIDDTVIPFVPAASSDRPYLIKSDEFFENDFNFIEDSYTFFDGDDVLADRNDMVVLDVEGTVGKDNLERWGWDPDSDENELYVCNIPKGLLVNITRSTGTYALEVTGFDPDAELKHSARRPLKMREYME